MMNQEHRDDAATVLDVRDMLCPLPILRTRKALNAMATGHVLEIRATDEKTWNDIPALCGRMEAELLERCRIDGSLVYRILKT